MGTRTESAPGALEALSLSGVAPRELLESHVPGDWGEVPPGDARENERSLKYGWRVLSSYPVGNAKVWVLTEADRSATTLLPSEY